MVQHSAEKAVHFIKDIAYRFGIMHRIITDLGTTFIGNTFWDHCECCGIEVYYTSVAHPRANGQVHRANTLVLDGIRACIEDTLSKGEGRWIKELYPTVWGLRTQPSKATG